MQKVEQTDQYLQWSHHIDIVIYCVKLRQSNMPECPFQPLLQASIAKYEQERASDTAHTTLRGLCSFELPAAPVALLDAPLKHKVLIRTAIRIAVQPLDMPIASP